MNVLEYNGNAWDKEVELNNPWTIPVTHAEIENAKNGDWSIFLTPSKAIPKQWLGNIVGKKILCLASGGGQQGPILSAAGAEVTVVDYSQKQLDKDILVMKNEGLHFETIRADMSNLCMLGNSTFDIIINPVSNCFIENVKPLWQECFRVLKREGILLSGFNNPIVYCFGEKEAGENQELLIRKSIPFSDLKSCTEEELALRIQNSEPLEFGHSLEDQIQGQIDSGFIITGFYEDRNIETQLIDKYMPSFYATKADKR